jgi:predicted peptidase
MQTAQHARLEKTLHFELDYLLFLPEGYDAKGEKRWPLILFLHGAGERGTNIWKVATHGPPKIAGKSPGFPFIVVSPQCPEGETWSDHAILALLDEILRTHAVDPKKVYLTGLSMGGYGTWSLGMKYPERFAAIAPVCGGGEPIHIHLASRTKERALTGLGVWAFHGAKDPVVPVVESERMIAALKKAGVKDVKLTIYPKAKHDSWTETYKNQALYDWFLEHERSESK